MGEKAIFSKIFFIEPIVFKKQHAIQKFILHTTTNYLLFHGNQYFLPTYRKSFYPLYT